MLTGKVKFFTKSWGSLTSDGDGKDYYIHVSCCERSGISSRLTKDQKVEFSLVEDFRTVRTKVDHVRILINERTISMSAMLKGKCKFWNHAKNWGFVTDSEGVDYFVHISTLEKSSLSELTKDQEVMFSTSKNDRTGRTQVDHLVIV